MAHLYEVLAPRVDRWRAAGYPTPDHPALGEILEWATDPESGVPRFLRRPQVRALETYWYLRLVEGTPHVLDLYRRLFPHPPDLLESLGLTAPELARQFLGTPHDDILQRVRTDDALVRRFRLESVRETLRLDYPSYILALAMGAGKTILIGAIFATEFAMALTGAYGTPVAEPTPAAVMAVLGLWKGRDDIGAPRKYVRCLRHGMRRGRRLQL